jgi:hypothetical protein
MQTVVIRCSSISVRFSIATLIFFRNPNILPHSILTLIPLPLSTLGQLSSNLIYYYSATVMGHRMSKVCRCIKRGQDNMSDTGALIPDAAPEPIS